jgi:hypothetical protein
MKTEYKTQFKKDLPNDKKELATFHSYLMTERGSEERSKELLLLQCYLEATDGEHPEDMD